MGVDVDDAIQYRIKMRCLGCHEQDLRRIERRHGRWWSAMQSVVSVIFSIEE